MSKRIKIRNRKVDYFNNNLSIEHLRIAIIILDFDL